MSTLQAATTPLTSGDGASIAPETLTVMASSIAGQERLLQDFGERIRDVRMGPDGWLYLLTDSDDGKIVRLVK